MTIEKDDQISPDYELDKDGFEKEDVGEQEEPVTQEKPFDPKKVDVSITTPNLRALIDRLKHEEIDLMPDFQRSSDLWTRQAQSRLIESILIRLPIPAFYFDALVDDKWQVVDGLQRLSAISNFVLKKKLHLTNLEFLTEYEGFSYDQLPRALQRRIDEFQTSVYLIKPGTPLVMKYSLFNRINTGGLKLTNQEIRHAMSQSINSGVASRFLSEIVKEELFCKMVGNNNNRMSYQELVLRHMAFILFSSDTYKSSLPKFLDSAMDELGRLGNEKRDSLRANFLASMKTAYDLFNNDAFKKTLAEPTHKKVVNKPLFEAVSVCLASIDDKARTRLTEQGDKFREEFKALLTDSVFHESISRSTANTDNVQMRFKMMKGIIEKFSGKDL
ncbi:DUF262 domain-containing protein [Nitrosomonas sp.]|uniref:DUF262 domain-containing protein n=1 Tax=Nitrosomonas sp. TaxID=42353 RepID=UPI0025E2C0A0|nr:DUF262 domain-containing protein [Nitrosomonas sp.]